MRLAVLGGGGFRVPRVVEALVQARSGQGPRAGLVVDEVCLHDVSWPRLRVVRDVLTGLLVGLRPGQAPRIRLTTDLAEAVRGADFIFSAVRAGGSGGRVVDEAVALEAGLLGQETVGVGGCAYALRTLPVVLEIARTVRDLAPEAWVVSFTNPAGVVTQAMRTVLPGRVVGVCDTPAGLVRRAAAALGVEPSRLSRVGGAGEVGFDYVGLNHLGWLRSLEVDGTDLLPRLLGSDALLGQVEEARAVGLEWVRALGMLPNEYLFYYYLNREAVARLRREDLTRGQALEAQQKDFYAAAAADPAQAARLWRQAYRQREATYMAESRPAPEGEGCAGGGGGPQVAEVPWRCELSGPPEGQEGHGAAGLNQDHGGCRDCRDYGGRGGHERCGGSGGRREEDVAGGGYQQVALDLMTAVATGVPARMVLDVANSDVVGEPGPAGPGGSGLVVSGGAGPVQCDGTGSAGAAGRGGSRGDLLVPQLREDAVVEVPCVVDGDGVHPQRVGALGGPELGLVAAVKGCEELLIEAALAGDKTLAWRALASHPLVDSVQVARQVLEGYISRHPQVGRLLGG